jgi:ferritin
MNQKIEDAFNKQINAELFSSYLYLSMSAYFEAQSLPGMASWMRAQAQEENTHAMKFYDFIFERDGRVTLTALDAPKTEWGSPLQAFEEAYKHECMISGRINDLVNLAIAEKDHASANFLQWFVTEQVEEEASVLAIVDQLKMVGDHSMGLFMTDRELGRRGAPAAE